MRVGRADEFGAMRLRVGGDKQRRDERFVRISLQIGGVVKGLGVVWDWAQVAMGRSKGRVKDFR